MNIPLTARDYIDERQDQYFIIWRNKKMEKVEPPIKPYFLSTRPVNYQWGSAQPTVESNIEGRRLSNNEKCTAMRYSVKHTGFVKKVNMQLEKRMPNTLMENHIMFPWRVLIDCEDFYTQFPNDNPLSALVFDFEVRTEKHMFPSAKRDPIIFFAANNNEYMVEDDNPKADEELCHKFVELIATRDYDILAGQNILNFDLPYLLERCRIHNIDTRPLTRNDSLPHFTRDNKLKIGGRAIYDNYFHGILLDQTLYGVKMRKGAGGQKAVMKRWGYDPKELSFNEMGNTYKLMNTERLREYGTGDKDDAITIFNHYFFTTQQIAEYMKVPLNFIMDYTSIFIPSIIQGRDMLMNNIFSDGQNKQRYPELHWASGSPTYQAAITAIIAECLRCHKYFIYGTDFNVCPHCRTPVVKKKEDTYVFQGGTYLQKLYKIDFKSYYDTIQINFNMSPVTTRLLRYDQYPRSKTFITPRNYPLPYCEHKDGKMILHVPDNKIGKTVVSEIDLQKESYTIQELEKIKAMRFVLKNQMKDIADKKSSEYLLLHSKNNAIKIVSKTFSGTNANGGMRYGTIIISINVTGIARDGMIFMMQYLLEHYGVDIFVEGDTDGIIINQKIDIDVLNEAISEYISNKYGIPCLLSLDLDEYDAGYFYKPKIYLLLENGQLVVHGGAFKSQQKPPIFDKVLEQLGMLKLKGELDKFEGIDFKDFEMEDFVKTKTMRMAPSQYKQPKSSDICCLGRQGELYGVPMSQGNKYLYIESKRFGYAHNGATYHSTHKILQSVKSRKEVDYTHYEDMMARLFETLRIPSSMIGSGRRQRDLSAFM